MLKLSHVKKTFNKGTVTEKRALTGVDLTLNDGDFVTVIGGNGVSTLGSDCFAVSLMLMPANFSTVLPTSSTTGFTPCVTLWGIEESPELVCT